ncbi:MAG: M50 family metallopeptidase [Oscillospiraceae bacterium]|nr:M50 family metallopeptidase [Oscillospiraceae bacterium]
MTNTFYWIAAALLLGILIMAHELGHFWFARWVGIKVMSFGIGFGPKLWSHTARNGITYVIRLLPLGGYCRYYGEDEAVDREGDAFYSQPVWKRALSTFAGPLMNFAAAILALFILYACLGMPTATLPSIGRVKPNSPASEAGLRPGDEFTLVNGEPVNTAEGVREAVMSVEPGGSVELTVSRGGEFVTVIVSPRQLTPESDAPQIGVSFEQAYTRYDVASSLKYSVMSTGYTISSMADFLRGLITGAQGAGGLIGPFGTIREVAGETEDSGVRGYLSMAALISINLGFINLLPIPGLDGSRLLFLLVEKIRRKRMDPNKEGIVHLVGLALLLLLMLPIYIKDIMSLFRLMG